jgi:hypothetical protein
LNLLVGIDSLAGPGSHSRRAGKVEFSRKLKSEPRLIPGTEISYHAIAEFVSREHGGVIVDVLAGLLAVPQITV